MLIYQGDLSVDDRGAVSFVNDFDFKDVKRFYIVENHERGFIRAWHGHKLESKYVLVVKGAILLRIVPLGGENRDVENYTLSDKQPKILQIPAGYANGFVTLTDDARVMFFSTLTLEETKGDDYRYVFNKWGGEQAWRPEYR